MGSENLEERIEKTLHETDTDRIPVPVIPVYGSVSRFLTKLRTVRYTLDTTERRASLLTDM